MPRPASSPSVPKEIDKNLSKPLLDFFNGYHRASRKTLDFVVKQFTELKVKKGDLVQTAASPCNNLYFVVKGILRGFIINHDKDITTWMTSENEMVTSVSGFFLQIPSPESIEALEDCHLLVLSYSGLQKIYSTCPDFNIVGRKILEFYYTFADDRAFLCRLTKATDRYNYFMLKNGHLINRIPLLYIASYLNMTIETLSRIRQKLRTKVR